MNFKRKITKLQEDRLENLYKKYDISKGIKVKATFPKMEITSHGSAAKVAATFGLGLVGLAATSGTKKSKIKKMTILQVVENGIVFKKAGSSEEDIRIPYSAIVKAEVISSKLSDTKVKITLLKNKEIELFLVFNDVKDTIAHHLVETINNNATGINFEESGWGLESNKDKTTSEDISEDNDLTSELKEIIQFYKDGLLTDEEFTKLKQKLLK